VQEILENFEFRNQIPRLSKADALGTLIERLLSPEINLSPNPVLHGDGSVKHPGLDNHAMGTIFEELVRRFNEENNEEAGTSKVSRMWSTARACCSPQRILASYSISWNLLSAISANRADPL
jgi:hypothetical protein